MDVAVSAVDAAVSAEGVSKRFGKVEALHDLTLQVPTGCVFGLVGPNGAGKTTLLRLILGLSEPTRGNLLVLGQRPTRRGRTSDPIGGVLEHPGFPPSMTVHDAARALAMTAGRRDALARVTPLLERFGLGDRHGARIGGLSLGLRQRFALATSLLADPSLVVLDEPMNGLDPGGIRDTRDAIRAMGAEGRTVIVSSHLLSELSLVCDRIAVIVGGRVVEEGPTDALDPGERVQVVTRNPEAAAAVLRRRGWSVSEVDGRIEVTGSTGGEVNAALVEEGFVAEEIHPVRRSLEETYFIHADGRDDR